MPGIMGPNQYAYYDITSLWYSVADPGFSVWGALTHWGVPTSDAYTFRQKHMQKRKKLILLGEGARRRRPPGSANGIVYHVHHPGQLYKHG